jgi:hypothetical protein
MGHVDIAVATALRLIEDAHRSVVTIADHPVIAAQCEQFRRSRRNLFRPRDGRAFSPCESNDSNICFGS